MSIRKEHLIQKEMEETKKEPSTFIWWLLVLFLLFLLGITYWSVFIWIN